MPGGGQLVTGRFAHTAPQTIDVHIAGLDAPIGCTPGRPFWSVDRDQFVEAGRLEIGERLRTHTNQHLQVTALLPRPGPEPVYNLEVQGEHVYEVSAAGVLVHNGCTDYTDDLSLAGDASRAKLRNNLGLRRGDADEAHHLLPLGLRDHDLVKKAARGGFEFNGAVNGMPLSFNRDRGVNIFHHNKYNTAIGKRLDWALEQAPNTTDIQAADFLKKYTERLRKGIGNSGAQLL